MAESNINRAGYLRESFHYFHLKDTAGQELDFHFHEFDKLVILLEGSVNYLVEEQSYALPPWSVLLVRHHAIHKAVIDRSRPYERIILYLDRQYFERAFPGAGLMDCFDQADRRRRYLLTATEEQLSELKTAIEAYEKAASDTRLGAQTMRETLIIQLLIRVNRLHEAAPERLEARGDPKVQEALSYINEHFREALTVEALAERVYLSPYHFMRLFKAQTGSTVHAYVRQKRLMHAARLIREGTPAAKAAADSGFGDYSAFHRAFKESFGISPGKMLGKGE
ncbi:MAG: helix-turn-helix domain-containing protein [Oscillospiraceae bacterium]|nr:helix-turn-helix domain-containing protein [Oscillospiraceae bacterium]